MKLFDRDVLGGQFFDEIGGLLERYVSIVVAVDEQHCDAGRFSEQPVEPQPGRLRLGSARIF
jgi:hypothetical protein